MELPGGIWAAAASLPLVLPATLLVRALARAGWPDAARVRAAAAMRLAAAMLVVGVAVAALRLPDRLRMVALCDELGPPRIVRTAAADGLEIETRIAHSFGMRHLYEEGLAWIEAPSLYRRDGITRYRQVGERIESEEVAQPSAQYALATESEHRDGGLLLHREPIREIAGGEVLASAATVTYDGGLARCLLGAWGVATCPNPVSAEGNRAFQASYQLARDTLRP